MQWDEVKRKASTLDLLLPLLLRKLRVPLRQSVAGNTRWPNRVVHEEQSYMAGEKA